MSRKPAAWKLKVQEVAEKISPSCYVTWAGYRDKVLLNVASKFIRKVISTLKQELGKDFKVVYLGGAQTNCDGRPWASVKKLKSFTPKKEV